MTNPITLLTLAAQGDAEDSLPQWDWSRLTDAPVDVVGALVVTAPRVDEPMTSEQAEAIRDDEGYVTVIVDVSLDEMLDATREAVLDQDDDHFDFLHEHAFDFGSPQDCSMRVVGVRPNGALMVEYRTLLEDDDY